MKSRQSSHTPSTKEPTLKAFLLEVLASMREGPTLFFAPIQGVIKAVRGPTPSSKRPDHRVLLPDACRHVKNAPVLRRGREWRRLALLPGLDRVTEHLYPAYERQQLVTVEPPSVPDKNRQRPGLFLGKHVVGESPHMGR